jgi:hypothetical protein
MIPIDLPLIVQDSIVASVFIVAMGLAVRRGLKRRKTASHSCHSCPAAEGQPLIRKPQL